MLNSIFRSTLSPRRLCRIDDKLQGTWLSSGSTTLRILLSICEGFVLRSICEGFVLRSIYEGG